MVSRLRELVKLFTDNKIDAFLVTKDINISYLTKFQASESYLFVSPKESFYITDFRYVLEAAKGLGETVRVRQYKGIIFDEVFVLAAARKIKRLGFDPNHLTVAQYQAAQKKCPRSVKLVPVAHLVETLREMKDSDEVSKVRQALVIHHQMLDLVKRKMKPGKRECDVLEMLEKFIKEKKVGFSFSPIIAAGTNSCFPHAKVTDRMIKKDDVVLVDTGIDFKGYKSDLTRMFFFGRMTPFLRETYETVRVAQRRAISEIRANVAVAQVDKAARGYLAEHNLDQYFGHALGHGVGLEIHESPRLSQASKAVLKEGMIVTVEPAVYIPGKFGIRYEDMVLVRKEKAEVISGNND
jgi:Xaa-Pro aminopeptidase